ncbi:MAG: peptidase S16 [Gammaproteobacteria bacterium]|nr:peptidase S16 [Gammaproteobacteria bacterium]
MTERQEIPLFPLGAVLFNGGRLPLKIFEPRYLDLVSRCMKDGSGFGVVLIRQGSDVHKADQAVPTIFNIGTLAKIVDFDPLAGGRLGIVCAGEGKFRIHRSWMADNHLTMAEVEFLPEETASPVGEEFAPLVDALREIAKHPMVEKLGIVVDYEDARSVGWRLAELLPVSPEIKQGLLQMHMPRERLAEIRRLLGNLGKSG